MSEHTDAWTDTHLDRRGRCAIIWTGDTPPMPLDRWERDLATILEHAAFVRTVEAELVEVIAKCQQIHAGREFGKRFWSRFAANLDGLHRVLAREAYYAAALEQAADRERRVADL